MNTPAELYKAIKDDSGLNDEALAILNVTENGLKSHIEKLKSDFGIDESKSIEMLFKLWKAQTDKTNAEPNEMQLMGFTLDGDTWTHHTGVKVTEDERKVFSFKLIESMVMAARFPKIGNKDVHLR